MNLDYSPEDVAFRDEVRAFIAQNYPGDLRARQDQGKELGKEDFLAWHRILAQKGWVAPNWPKDFGGPGWTPVQKFIFAEECASSGTIPDPALRHRHGRTGDPDVRHAGTESEVPAADARRRHLVVPRLFGTWCRIRPRIAFDQGCARRRSLRSSTDRRPGQRSRSMPTGVFSWSVRILPRRSRKASASCLSI